MWVFYVECELGIRVRPLDVRRLKGTRGRGKVVYDYALGPFMFVGPKLIQLGIYLTVKAYWASALVLPGIGVKGRVSRGRGGPSRELGGGSVRGARVDTQGGDDDMLERGGLEVG